MSSHRRSGSIRAFLKNRIKKPSSDSPATSNNTISASEKPATATAPAPSGTQKNDITEPEKVSIPISGEAMAESTTAATAQQTVNGTVDGNPKNNSFVLKSIKNVAFEDRPIPQIKDPYDVLINVKWTGICGSDVHYWDHGGIGSYTVKEPMVLGHESAGVVSQVGSAVTHLKPGDRVAMEPGISCRRCEYCKGGKYNFCRKMVFAATPPYDGTLAKYYILPEDLCFKLPENVSLEEGALVEPLGVAVHITKQADIKPGESVVVFGAGPVGLLCCAVARAFGAEKIIAVDIQPARLAFAKEYAATAVFEPSRVSSEENAARLKSENDLPAGLDVAIDASGVEPSVNTGIHALRMGGTYVQGGMGRSEITFPIMAACTKELTVKGSFRYNSGDYKLAIDLIASGKVDAKSLISKKVKFTDAEQAFTDVKAGKGIKTLIEGPE